jgi:cytosine/adenosine deaminase-related metal-dependent hydrolase
VFSASTVPETEPGRKIIPCNPARFLGIEKDLGTIEKGKIANLVLLDADPFADIRNTTKISEVFLAGKEFPRQALDQMLKNAEGAAKSAAIK